MEVVILVLILVKMPKKKHLDPKKALAKLQKKKEKLREWKVSHFINAPDLIHICWIRTGSQPYWKIMYRIV